LIAVGLGISAFLLWLALRNMQLTEFRDAMRQVDYTLLFPLTVCLLTFYWVRTYRWKLLLGHLSDVRTRELFGPVMIGYGANFLLPFQVGELARSFAARRSTNLPFMPIAFSILVERLFDFIVTLLALALALTFHEQLPGYLRRFGLAAALIVAALIVTSLLFAIYTNSAITLIGRCLRVLPTSMRDSVLRQLRSGAMGLHSLLDGKIVLKAALVSLAQWTVFLGCIWITLHAVGMTVPVQTLLLILALMVLGSSVPNAPGYLGSIQAGYVLALEATNGDAAKGLAASIVFHVLYAVTAIGIGLYALRRASIDLRNIGDLGAEGGDAVPAPTGKSS
jgi:uncharacterized protein (TIRG00374 family)